MARNRYQFIGNELPHFLTCTTVNWIPVFTRVETASIVLDSWRFLQEQNRLTIYGYVILENHLHLIASAEDLSKEIANFKSFTARKIIDYLKERNEQRILKHLNFYKLAHKTDRDYQFWQEGSHPQLIQNEEMMRQKLEYIHYNPVRRGYVDEPTHWRYSSARNYAGQSGLLEVKTDW
jgi:REP element-mobilizing transposase RayT